MNVQIEKVLARRKKRNVKPPQNSRKNCAKVKVCAKIRESLRSMLYILLPFGLPDTNYTRPVYLQCAVCFVHISMDVKICAVKVWKLHTIQRSSHWHITSFMAGKLQLMSVGLKVVSASCENVSFAPLKNGDIKWAMRRCTKMQSRVDGICIFDCLPVIKCHPFWHTCNCKRQNSEPCSIINVYSAGID